MRKKNTPLDVSANPTINQKFERERSLFNAFRMEHGYTNVRDNESTPMISLLSEGDSNALEVDRRMAHQNEVTQKKKSGCCLIL